jgi:hypothetical protein
MVSGNTAPDRTARIVSLLAMVVALAGGLWLFNPASRDTEAAAVVATSCSGFAADAKTMFDKGDSVMLSGAFAPGDHVHLAIDFKGARYGWQLTGAPASEKSEVTGSGAFTITKSTVTDTASRTTVAITLAPSSSKPRSTVFTWPKPATTSTTVHGTIGGFARMEVDVDVTKAGDGAIAIDRTGGSSLTPPMVASASCTAARKG